MIAAPPPKIDDDVFFLLHAASEGYQIDMRAYPRALKLGLILPKPPTQRRTWMTDFGRSLYVAECERRDRAASLAPALVSGDDDEEEGQKKQRKHGRRDPSVDVGHRERIAARKVEGRARRGEGSHDDHDQR